MLKRENKIAQAAIELAVFGAILIFILGTIVRSAVSNGYAQNGNFKAMRMAMLASWNSSKANNMSRTSASILFVEDRLSPDVNKYGDVDRTPILSQGAGTFSYMQFYPLSATEVPSNLPLMDIYINGQHFPLTNASYITNRTITRPVCPSGGPYPPPENGGSLPQAQCLQNQCLRNAREWGGGVVDASQFDAIIPVPQPINAGTAALLTANGIAIFQALVDAGLVATTCPLCVNATAGYVTNGYTGMPNTFSAGGQALTQQEIQNIQVIMNKYQHPFKLFYTIEVNGTSVDANGGTQFSPVPPPTCTSSPNVSNELCSNLTVVDATGTAFTNTNGDMQYDLLRLGNYTSSLLTYPSVETRFPPGVPFCSDLTMAANMRCYIAWQWAASAAVVQSNNGFQGGVLASEGVVPSLGLDPTQNQYPQFDIDGRLNMVTIYAFSQNSDGTPKVSYEDPDGGDIDGGWNINTCGPKPGLQNNQQIFTFTKTGTYLQMLEGKLYNPETDQFVRSADKRDNVDLIQRQIQLSNNTGRFCGSTCGGGSLCYNGQCSDGSGSCTYTGAPLPTVANDGVTPNPVEVCIPPASGGNCFSSQQNIASTCYDENDNMVFVRSRLEDRRGKFWMTDASGQLLVQ